MAPMKIFKFTLIALITTTLLSCSDNSYEPELNLTNESLAGNYNITILNIDIESSVRSQKSKLTSFAESRKSKYASSKRIKSRNLDSGSLLRQSFNEAPQSRHSL